MEGEAAPRMRICGTLRSAELRPSRSTKIARVVVGEVMSIPAIAEQSTVHKTSAVDTQEDRCERGQNCYRGNVKFTLW